VLLCSIITQQYTLQCTIHRDSSANLPLPPDQHHMSDVVIKRVGGGLTNRDSTYQILGRQFLVVADDTRRKVNHGYTATNRVNHSTDFCKLKSSLCSVYVLHLCRVFFRDTCFFNALTGLICFNVSHCHTFLLSSSPLWLPRQAVVCYFNYIKLVMQASHLSTYTNTHWLHYCMAILHAL